MYSDWFRISTIATVRVARPCFSRRGVIAFSISAPREKQGLATRDYVAMPYSLTTADTFTRPFG